jgi:hypothetical protein
MIKSGLKSWKTTVVGILLVLSSLAYLYFVEPNDKLIFFGTLISGILLLFSPDTYINSVQSLLLKLIKKAEKINIEDEINK